MIEHTIYNRFTWEPLFTAEIDCEEGTDTSVKTGLAVRWAIENGAELRYASLVRANLEGAELRGASLWCANLEGANLEGAELRGASLVRANLVRANLRGAELRGAELRGAELRGAELRGIHGVNDYIKSLHLEEWPISYTSEVIQIGCERHAIEEWRGFDDARIAAMGGKRALKFWRKYKVLIFQVIETCPAKPAHGGEQ